MSPIVFQSRWFGPGAVWMQIIFAACALTGGGIESARAQTNYRFTGFVDKDAAPALGPGSGVSGIAVDAAGNVYVASYTCVLRVTANGTVSLLAGDPVAGGFGDGTGADARLHIRDIAVDRAGNVLVADDANGLVRRITPAGVVSTVAGWPGSFVGAVAEDSAGNIFVGDLTKQVIRKITPAGVATVFAGEPEAGGSTDGVGSAARLTSPEHFVIDETGALIFVDGYGTTLPRLPRMGG